MAKFRPSVYFGSWWLPSTIFLALVVALTVALRLSRSLAGSVVDVLLGAAGLAFIGVVSAAVWNFAQKRWSKGFIQLLLAVTCTGVAFAAGIFLMLTGPSEDGFADRLEIPAGLAVAEPKAEFEPQESADRDPFQSALHAALRIPGTEDASITADVSALAALQKNAPELLRRYLASSPAWRLFEERGELYATRRWSVGGEWRPALHGYYSRDPVDQTLPHFQTRLTIGLSGKPWARANSGNTALKEGETARVKTEAGHSLHTSHCVIAADSLVVEVFEESDAVERRLTKAALQFLQAEFGALLDAGKWEAARAALLPPDAIRRAEPSCDLRKSFQGGIYEAEIWVNPGEPGTVYLKAFEVTKGTPLSERDLKQYSSEKVGWSDDPGEVFLAKTLITISEGDWDKHYAARFEVWFAPDSGAPERKLLDKVFRIEGWQR